MMAKRDEKRISGKIFALSLVALMALILVSFFALRRVRERAWLEAGGDRIVEGVTPPVVQQRHR